MGDTCKLYRSVVLSGMMSICICHSERLLLTTHGDRAGRRCKSGRVCFLKFAIPEPLRPARFPDRVP